MWDVRDHPELHWHPSEMFRTTHLQCSWFCSVETVWSYLTDLLLHSLNKLQSSRSRNAKFMFSMSCSLVCTHEVHSRPKSVGVWWGIPKRPVTAFIFPANMKAKQQFNPTCFTIWSWDGYCGNENVHRIYSYIYAIYLCVYLRIIHLPIYAYMLYTIYSANLKVRKDSTIYKGILIFTIVY